MKRWMKSTVKTAAVAAITLMAAGCLMHAMMMSDVEPPAASDFGTGPRKSAAGHYAATIVPGPEGLKVRKLQTVRLAVTDADGRPLEGLAIGIDGGMPQHGHGLPTQPRVTRALGGGEYLVEGLRFNMGGWWELELDVDGPLGRDSIVFNLDL